MYSKERLLFAQVSATVEISGASDPQNRGTLLPNTISDGLREDIFWFSESFENRFKRPN